MPVDHGRPAGEVAATIHLVLVGKDVVVGIRGTDEQLRRYGPRPWTRLPGATCGRGRSVIGGIDEEAGCRHPCTVGGTVGRLHTPVPCRVVRKCRRCPTRRPEAAPALFVPAVKGIDRIDLEEIGDRASVGIRGAGYREHRSGRGRLGCIGRRRQNRHRGCLVRGVDQECGRHPRARPGRGCRLPGCASSRSCSRQAPAWSMPCSPWVMRQPLLPSPPWS